MNGECSFCKYFGDMVAFDRIRQQGNPKLHHDYHALILQRTWNDYTGTAHAGTMTHRPKAVGFDLNYCPECGRKMEGHKDGEH